jgi:hypothetical protein
MALKVNQKNELDPAGKPLIPSIAELTKLVLQGLTDDAQREAAKAIQAEIQADANIELILSRVRLLAEALGAASLHELNGEGFQKLAKAICDQIGRIVNAELPKQRNAYNELLAWISGTLRSHPVEIFTTNYDLLFEEAFESVRAPYFDGFSGGSRPFFDPVTVAASDLPNRWSRLWKMHGSLGWKLVDGAVVRVGGSGEAQLIYPDHLKYDLTQKQPYSALFARLKQFLLEPDTLLITTGFSYRDAHVSSVLQDALAMNSSAAAFSFQFGALDEEKAACEMAYDRANLSVYARDGAIINGVRGKWRLGDPPKNWKEIRSSFWGKEIGDQEHFLLGDFKYLARFCALAQAVDMSQPQKLPVEDDVVANGAA